MIIKIKDYAGTFAENKDKAKEIRTKILVPALDKKQEITIDFQGIDATTQSFTHALLSDIIRKYDDKTINLISFKNCNENVKKVITIVFDYTQEAER